MIKVKGNGNWQERKHSRVNSAWGKKTFYICVDFHLKRACCNFKFLFVRKGHRQRLESLMVATVFGNSEPHHCHPPGHGIRCQLQLINKVLHVSPQLGLRNTQLNSGLADLWYTVAGVWVYPTWFVLSLLEDVGKRLVLKSLEKLKNIRWSELLT